jgi:hypothetical protein
MVQLNVNLTLLDLGILHAGQHYQLPDGLEAALVAEGRAVYVTDRHRPPHVAALSMAPRRKRRAAQA